MSKFNFIIFVSLLIASLNVWSATATPTGNWQLTTSIQVEITNTAGKKIKSNPINGLEFATFSSNFSYVSSEWINRLNAYFPDTTGAYLMPIDVVGQWSIKGSAYTINYDPILLSFRNKTTNINEPFFDRIKDSYINMLSNDLGYTPSITKIQILNYNDTGKLLKTGQSLSGLKTLLLAASWVDPTSSKSLSELMTVTIKYTGRRNPVTTTCCVGDATQNASASETFLNNNANNLANVIKTTASGLQYVILQDQATGEAPLATDTVTVNYRGFFPNGIQFDSGSLVTFPLGNVIPGWTEGLKLMKPGAKYRFFIPSNLAYGESGKTDTASGRVLINPNSALIFDVELVAVSKSTS